MALIRSIRQALILGALCVGAASCASLPDILPFPSPSPKEKAETPVIRGKSCRPVRNKDITYTVRKGDTLGEIAQCFKASRHNIARRNNIKNPNRIKVGQKLIIPARTGKAARSGSKTPLKKASKPMRPPARAKSGIVWAWPVKGKIIRKFSPKGSGKQGIAISGKMGQAIKSAASGKVVYSGDGLVGYGRLIIVQHEKEFLTAYAHNDRLLVKEGQRVKKGQMIARMGKTAARSPRLHFEMRYKGKPVDPLAYLP